MRNREILAVILLMVFMTGCENPELVQCQQDNQALQGQLQEWREQLKQEKQTSEQMIDMMMQEIETMKKDHAAQLQQTKKEIEDDFTEQLRKQRAKLDERTMSLLESRSAIKNLEANSKELQEKLSQADEKFEKTAEMLRVLGAENEKLKAKIEELQGAVEEEPAE